jgi:methylated-DNA-protein-cysteine methyltransferase-like protein
MQAADPDTAETRLRDVLRRVPPGRVVTYGLLADLAGRPGRARWAARVLSRADDPELPWHRVIAAGGRIALPADSPSGITQRERLRAEGVVFRGERVDLSAALWRQSLADLLFG